MIKFQYYVILSVLYTIHSVQLLNSTSFQLETKDYKQYENDKIIVKCLIEICLKYSNNKIPVILFSQDIKNVNTAEMFVRNLRDHRIIENGISYNATDGLYIVFINNRHKVQHNINHLRIILKPEIYNMEYMVVLVRKSETNTTKNIETISLLMEEFWRLRLINMAILTETEQTLNIYTYFPYSKQHCSGVGNPILLEKWDKSEVITKLEKDIFPIDDKIRNLYGCSLNGIGKTRPPESIIIPKQNNTWELKGTGGYMLSAVEKYLNFKTSIAIPANKSVMDEFGYSVADGIPQKITENLVTGEKDFAFGIYSHIIYFFPGTEFTKAAMSECFIWYAPCGAGRKPSKWNNYIKEFTFTNWCMILLIFIITITINKLPYNILKKYCSKINEKKHVTILTIYATCLGQSVGKQINNLISKSFTLVWLFYCLIIYSLYQATLGSFMTVPWQTKNIETLKEILDYNYKPVGNPQSFNIFNKSINRYNKTLAEIAKRFQKIDQGTYNSVIKHIVDDRDTVSFGAKRFQQHYSVYRSKDVKSKDHMCSIGDECMIQSSASPFLLKKGSPFAKPINEITDYLFESGILNWLWKINEPKVQKLKNIMESERKFKLKQLKGAFIIYAFGIILAAIVFFFEQIYYHCFTNHTKKNIAQFNYIP